MLPLGLCYRVPAAAGTWPAHPATSLPRLLSLPSPERCDFTVTRPRRVSVAGSGECRPGSILSSSHPASCSASSAWLATRVLSRWDQPPHLTRVLRCSNFCSWKFCSASQSHRVLPGSVPLHPAPPRPWEEPGHRSSLAESPMGHRVPLMPTWFPTENTTTPRPRAPVAAAAVPSPRGFTGSRLSCPRLHTGLLGVSECMYPSGLSDVFRFPSVASTLPGCLYAEPPCPWAPPPQAPGRVQLRLSPAVLPFPAMLRSPLPCTQPRLAPDPSAGTPKASHPPGSETHWPRARGRGRWLPDVLVGHHEGLAERLGRVQPHPGVLLHSGRELPGDGHGAGVQGAGDGRQQGLIGAAGPHACRGAGGAVATSPQPLSLRLGFCPRNPLTGRRPLARQ